MKRNELDPIVEKIAKRNTRETIDLSLRDIQVEVLKITGEEPSTSVLSACFDRLGIVTGKSNVNLSGKSRRWVWVHRKSHE